MGKLKLIFCVCVYSLCQYKASLIMEINFVIPLLYIFSNGVKCLVSIQPVYSLVFGFFCLPLL